MMQSYLRNIVAARSVRPEQKAVPSLPRRSVLRELGVRTGTDAVSGLRASTQVAADRTMMRERRRDIRQARIDAPIALGVGVAGLAANVAASRMQLEASAAEARRVAAEEAQLNDIRQFITDYPRVFRVLVEAHPVSMPQYEPAGADNRASMSGAWGGED